MSKLYISTLNKSKYIRKVRTEGGDYKYIYKEPDKTKVIAGSSIAVVKDRKLLMGLRRDSKKWTLPGGGRDAGESNLETAKRELFEEAGIKTNKEFKKIGKKEIRKKNKKVMEVHSYLLELDSKDKTEITSKNDPDKEVYKWVWIDIKNGLPDKVKNNLHHKKNVTLQLLKLQEKDMEVKKGGPGSGRRPETESWTGGGFSSDKDSVFYESPGRKLKNRILLEMIKKKEKESWEKLKERASKESGLKVASLNFVIDLMKGRPHKYIRKYRGRDGKWVYVYEEGKGRRRKVEQESIDILRELANRGNERASAMLDEKQKIPNEAMDILRELADRGRENAKEKLTSLGIDRKKERLEEDVLGVPEPEQEEPQQKELTEEQQQKFDKAVRKGAERAVKRGFEYPNANVIKQMFRAIKNPRTKEAAYDRFLEQSRGQSIEERLNNLNVALKKIDVEQENTGSFSSSFSAATQAGGYANLIWNDTIKALEAEGILPEGYNEAVPRRPQEDVNIANPDRIQEEIEQRRREEAERREREEREARERLEREHRELFEAHGESLEDALEYYNITGASDEKKVNIMKGMEKFFGKDFSFKEMVESFQGHPEVEIVIPRSFLQAFERQSTEISAVFSFKIRESGQIMGHNASRRIYKNSDGSIRWKNSVFDRPKNSDLKRYPGMASGLYGGVYKFLKKVTANYSDEAKNNTRVIIGTAANSGFSDRGYKGALVWAKHNFDFPNSTTASTWKERWKAKVDGYARKLKLSEQMTNEIKQKIDTFKYPYEFVTTGFSLKKEEMLKCTGNRIDWDFKQLFENKGYVDIGEIIMIDTGTQWSSPVTYLWRNNSRENHLRERREKMYGLSGQRERRQPRFFVTEPGATTGTRTATTESTSSSTRGTTSGTSPTEAAARFIVLNGKGAVISPRRRRKIMNMATEDFESLMTHGGFSVNVKRRLRRERERTSGTSSTTSERVAVNPAINARLEQNGWAKNDSPQSDRVHEWTRGSKVIQLSSRGKWAYGERTENGELLLVSGPHNEFIGLEEHIGE